jgi:lia operon protein LiaF
MSHDGRSSYVWGLILIAIGALFLLQNFDFLDAGEIISDFWPLILVAFGIKMLMDHRRGDREEEVIFTSQPEPDSKSSGDFSDRITQSNVFGDMNLRFKSSSFQGGTVSNVFGDIHVDLTSVIPAEPEGKLYINGIFGDIVVHLPQGVALKLRANVIAGDLNARNNRRDGLFPALEIQDENYATAEKRLFIQCSMIFGSVNIIS